MRPPAQRPPEPRPRVPRRRADHRRHRPDGPIDAGARARRRRGRSPHVAAAVVARRRHGRRHDRRRRPPVPAGLADQAARRRGRRWSPSRRASSRSTTRSASRAARCATCSPTPAGTRSTGAEPIARRAGGGSTPTPASSSPPRPSSERAGMPFADYLAEAVLAAARHDVDARCAARRPTALRGTVDDLARFLAELQRPTLLAAATARRRRHGRSIPDLAGIVPGVGRFDPCPWGLGFEIRGDKSPHWTGHANSRGHVRPLRRRRHDDVGRSRRPGARSSPSPTDRSTTGRSTRCDAWPELSDAVVAEVGRGA